MNQSIMTVLLLILLAPAVLALPPEGEEIVMEEDLLVSDRESYEAVTAQLQVAENSVMDYLRESTTFIQQGYLHGFATFRVWFRQYHHDSEQPLSPNDALLRQLLQVGLRSALNQIFPGSTSFMDTLRTHLSTVYQNVTANLNQIPQADIGLFLDAHEAALQASVIDLLTVPEQFRRDHADIVEAAQWTMLQESVDRAAETGRPPTADLGARTRQLLQEAGIPEPGSATAALFAERTCREEIRHVLLNSRGVAELQRTCGSDLRDFAHATALRALYSDQRDVYCYVYTMLDRRCQPQECWGWSPPPEDG